MTEPVFSDTTERLYNRLPAIYRLEDANNNWSFKKYISGVVDREGEIDVLINRFEYDTPDDGVPSDTSDLVDPVTADASWLPWLAQLVGVMLLPSDTTAQWRIQIGSALSSARPGTKAAIAEAAKKVLTGTQSVAIYAFSNTLGIGAGTQWDVLIITVAEETTSDPVDAVIKAGAKPAGVVLHHLEYGATWADIEATLPTWADWDGKTWQQIQEVGL